MTSEQLRYVVELANYGTMQKTADALHITKSGLSKAIHQIENELGIPLFTRKPSGSSLTPQGQELLPIIQQELSANFKLYQSANNLKKTAAGKIVKVGYVNSLMRPVVDEFLAMKKAGNSASLEISQHSTDELIRLVENQSLDVAFIDLNKERFQQLKYLQFHEIHHGPLQLFLRKDNPLASKQRLTIQDIRQLNFITIKNPIDEAIFDHLQNICGPLNVVMKTDDYWSACEAAKQLDLGIIACYLILGNAVPNIESFDLGIIHVDNLINDEMYHGWITNPNNLLDMGSQDFITGVAKRSVEILGE